MGCYDRFTFEKDFSFQNHKGDFIVCKEWGITTQFEENIDEAIRVWNKAFAKDSSEYHDHVCLGCSGNFGKD